MANLRFQVVEEAFKKKPTEVITPVERPSEFFGKYVFNRAKMYKYLPASVYEKLIDVIDNGSTLDRSIADARLERVGEESYISQLTIQAKKTKKGERSACKIRCIRRFGRRGRHAPPPDSSFPAKTAWNNE